MAKYSDEKIFQEIGTHRAKIDELRQRCVGLESNNAELKRMCLFLDAQRQKALAELRRRRTSLKPDCDAAAATTVCSKLSLNGDNDDGHDVKQKTRTGGGGCGCGGEGEVTGGGNSHTNEGDGEGVDKVGLYS